jgi:hypothetical protein
MELSLDGEENQRISAGFAPRMVSSAFSIYANVGILKIISISGTHSQ